MKATTLDGEIRAYEGLLAQIRQQHGPSWALVADQKLVRTFSDFPSAARYAREHFGRKEVLIRHTEERQLETAPFVQVHAGK